MTVQELIEKLQQMDPSYRVKCETGSGIVDIEDVDTQIERDSYDGDWDKSIVVIKVEN